MHATTKQPSEAKVSIHLRNRHMKKKKKKIPVKECLINVLHLNLTSPFPFDPVFVYLVSAVCAQ